MRKRKVAIKSVPMVDQRSESGVARSPEMNRPAVEKELKLKSRPEKRD